MKLGSLNALCSTIDRGNVILCISNINNVDITPADLYEIVTIREPSLATITKPLFINTRGETVDPEFELSKKYTTVGYLTKPINLTVQSFLL